MTAPDGAWIDWGGEGAPLVFSHANGFPTRSYARLLGLLRTGFRVASLDARPLWPGSDPSTLPDWGPLAADLQETVDARGFRGAVGMGHSLGAVCSLRAAVADPGLFRALVLIDPVLFTGFRAFAWGVMRRHGWTERTPIVAGAVRRRDRWQTPAEARDGWRRKALFRDFTDGCFDDYLADALVPHPEGGWTLRYPKAWEAAVFRTTPSSPWKWVRQAPVPTLVIRGEHSDTLSPAALERCGALLPKGRVVEVPGTGHMAPLERPEAVAEVVLEFLRDVG